MVLFVEDHQLLKSEFYEYLNSLISGGEIPGLFTPQELEPMLQAILDEMKNQYEY
jgi:dynein heavy chain 2